MLVLKLHCLIITLFLNLKGDRDPTAYGKVVERRKVLISSVGMLVAGFWWNASVDGVSVAAEFADSNLHTSLTMTFIHYICAREHCFFFFWLLENSVSKSWFHQKINVKFGWISNASLF